MHRPRKLVYPEFLPYFQVRTSQPPAGTLWVDVSSDAEEPFCQLSPFYPHGGIPVPGLLGTFSDSVEGIWQGLKVIRGKIAPRFFVGMGRKRGGKPAGHQYGQSPRLLNIVEARQRIYIPAYRWMIEHCAPKEVLELFLGRAFQGVPQFLYDKEDNPSINKDAPLAHAAVLVQLLCQRIDQQLQRT